MSHEDETVSFELSNTTVTVGQTAAVLGDTGDGGVDDESHSDEEALHLRLRLYNDAIEARKRESREASSRLRMASEEIMATKGSASSVRSDTVFSRGRKHASRSPLPPMGKRTSEQAQLSGIGETRSLSRPRSDDGTLRAAIESQSVGRVTPAKAFPEMYKVYSLG